MIKLLVEGKELVLDRTEGITINRQSALFGNEGIKGSRSFTFKAPDVPQNERVLGHLRHIRIQNRKVRYGESELMYKGAVVNTGTAVILSYEPGDGYELVLTANSFKLAIEGLRLRDLNYGLPVSLGVKSEDVVAHAQSDYAADGYCFPEIHNPKFYGDEEAWSGWINLKTTDHAKAVNRIRYASEDDAFKDNRFAFCPAIYHSFILQRIADTIGYTFDGDFFTDPRTQKLCMRSAVPLDAFADALTGTGEDPSINGVGLVPLEFSTTTGGMTPTSYTSQEDGRLLIQFSGDLFQGTKPNSELRAIYRLYKNGSEFHQEEISLTYNVLINHTSEVKWFFRKSDVLTLAVEFEFGNGTNWTSVNGSALNVFVEVSNEQQAQLNVYKKTLDLKDHVDDLTVEAYLVQIRDSFNLDIRPHPLENRITFDLAESVVTRTTFMDLTPYLIVDPGSYRNQPKVEFGQREGFTLRYDNDLLQVNELTIGDGSKQQTFKLAPLLAEYCRDPLYKSSGAVVFHDDQVAESPLNDSETTTKKYRFATPEPNINGTLNPELGGSSTDLSALLLESYRARHQADKATFYFDLPLNIIQALDLGIPVLIDGAYCLIETSKTSYADHVGITEMEVWVI